MSIASLEKTEIHIQPLPQHIEDKLRNDTNGNALGQFRALPPTVQDRCAKLCRDIDAQREQRNKYLPIAEIADIIGEYFDGHGTIFECLTNWNFFKFKDLVVDKSESTIMIRMLTKLEAAALKTLPDFIGDSDGEDREKQIVAWIRLAQKSYAEKGKVTTNKILWRLDDNAWHSLRKKWIGMTTQELIPDFLTEPQAAEPVQDAGVSAIADQSVQNARNIIHADNRLDPSDDASTARGSNNGHSASVQGEASASRRLQEVDTEAEEDAAADNAESATETVTIPDAVQATLDQLFAAYEQAGGSSGRVPEDAQRHAVEMFRIAREYGSKSLFKRTGKFVQTLEHYAKSLGIPMLDQTETAVLQKLGELIQVQKGVPTGGSMPKPKKKERDAMPMEQHVIRFYPEAGRQDLSDDEKRIIFAAFRLQQKQSTHRDAVKWWKSLGISTRVRNESTDNFAKKKTRELIPSIFEQAEKELGLLSEDKDPDNASQSAEVTDIDRAITSLPDDKETDQGVTNEDLPKATVFRSETAARDPEPLPAADMSAGSSEDFPSTHASSLPPLSFVYPPAVLSDSATEEARLSLAQKLHTSGAELLASFRELPTTERTGALLKQIAQTFSAVGAVLNGHHHMQENPRGTGKEIDSPAMTYQTPDGGTITVSADVQGTIVILGGQQEQGK